MHKEVTTPHIFVISNNEITALPEGMNIIGSLQ